MALTDSLIQETAYTRAIQPLDFATGTIKDPGSHAWARQLVLGYVTNMEPDVHLRNMLRQVYDHLLQNKPVQAMDWLRDIQKHLKERNAI